MPCNSITTQSVALKNAVPSIVEKALTAAGWDITGSTAATIVARKGSDILDWIKGRGMTVSGRINQTAITEITREYSKQAVTWAASRAGWNVNATGSNTLTATRRQ